MDGDKEHFYLVLFFLRASGNWEPIEQNFINRHRYVLARLYRHDLCEVLLHGRGELDKRDERRAIRYGDRGVCRCHVCLADNILKRFCDFFRRQGCSAAYLDAGIRPERDSAIGLEYDRAALFAKLHDLDGRGTYVHP